MTDITLLYADINVLYKLLGLEVWLQWCGDWLVVLLYSTVVCKAVVQVKGLVSEAKLWLYDLRVSHCPHDCDPIKIETKNRSTTRSRVHEKFELC